MIRQPLLSVIIPVYNVAQYLEKTLCAVTGQTYTNIEIILVDDGSTDGSGQLCDLWAQKDSRIQVIHQQNAGPSCARNAGIDASSGELILFCDSDDLPSTQLCQRLYESLSDDAGMAICEYVHIFDGKPFAYSEGPLELLTAQEAVCRLWYQQNMIPSACAKLYRREVFDTLRFTPGLFFEDIDLLHELMWTAGKIVYNHSGLYGYVHRTGSITTGKFSERDMDIFRVTERLLSFAQAHPELTGAAQAYTVTAALRIYLNAPRQPEYAGGLGKAEQILNSWGRRVKTDPRLRRKNRIALWLYFFSKPLLLFVYQRINRWS